MIQERKAEDILVFSDSSFQIQMHLDLKKNIGFFFLTIKDSFVIFQKNDPLRLAGATAFFTNFALPPILLILIRLFGYFTDRRKLVDKIFERLANILDKDSIHQIRLTLKNIRSVEQNWYVTIISFVFFLFVATTLFTVIKNSVEQVWNVGYKERRGIFSNLVERAKAFTVILLAGLLFFIGLLADSIQAFLGSFISGGLYGVVFFASVLNQFIFVLIVTVWFSVLFRFLTNGRPSWKSAVYGGLLTGCLFTLGKYLLRILLPLSNIGNVYGSAGSIVVIMLFVFYSSLIFYFGASFVKALSDKKEFPIEAKNGSYIYEQTAVEIE